MTNQSHGLSKTQQSMPLAKSSPVYAEWITVQLVKIAMLMGEQVSAERFALTVDELREIEPDVLNKAFAVARKQLRFFPKPGDIHEIIRHHMLGMKFSNR